jgi:hypothetical protein
MNSMLLLWDTSLIDELVLGKDLHYAKSGLFQGGEVSKPANSNERLTPRSRGPTGNRKPQADLRIFRLQLS